MNSKLMKITIKQVKDECKKLGIKCKWLPDTKEFCIDGYFTDDAKDAIDTAKHMAAMKGN